MPQSVTNWTKISHGLPWAWKRSSAKVDLHHQLKFVSDKSILKDWMLNVIAERNLDMNDIYLRGCILSACLPVFLMFHCSTLYQNSDSAQFPTFLGDLHFIYLFVIILWLLRNTFSVRHCLGGGGLNSAQICRSWYFWYVIFTHLRIKVEVLKNLERECFREFRFHNRIPPTISLNRVWRGTRDSFAGLGQLSIELILRRKAQTADRASRTSNTD